jgi:hypothetical protein
VKGRIVLKTARERRIRGRRKDLDSILADVFCGTVGEEEVIVVYVRTRMRRIGYYMHAHIDGKQVCGGS